MASLPIDANRVGEKLPTREQAVWEAGKIFAYALAELAVSRTQGEAAA